PDPTIPAQLGPDTPLPPLQLAVKDPNSSSSNCGEGYSCSYTNSISWIALPTKPGEVQRTSPLPMELNSQVVFERLFGSGSTPEVRAARMHENRSILDSVLAELANLTQALGARDLTARAYVFPKSELFPNGGVSPGFHGASHHQEDPVQVKRYADINRYHVSTLAYFAEKLKSIPDGDGTLLDRSLVMYGTN